jgi:hypothetical protein
MKTLLLISLILLFAPSAYAGRVTIDKSTGKFIEYQSAAREGALLKSAISAGYKAEDVEEREVTPSEWKEIYEEQVVKPANDAQKQADAAKKAKEKAIREKLGLTAAEFADLRDALR